MKIRLMGSADLVRAWQRALEQEYNIQGTEYPSRRGTGDARAYFDLDDRTAAAIVGITAPRQTPDAATIPQRITARAQRRTLR